MKQHLQIKSLPCCNSFLFFSLVFFTFFCNFFIQQGSATQNLRTNGIRMWPVEQKLWYEARQTQACRNFGGRKLDLPSRFLQKQFRRFSAVSENVYFCPIPSWNEKVTAVLLSTPRNRVSAAAEETNVVWTTWYGWMVVETQTLRRWTNFNQQLNTKKGFSAYLVYNCVLQVMCNVLKGFEPISLKTQRRPYNCTKMKPNQEFQYTRL